MPALVGNGEAGPAKAFQSVATTDDDRPGLAPAKSRQFSARLEANSKSQRHWTPACAGAPNRYRPPCPRSRHDNPPAMAKPSRQFSPSAAPSGARGRRELSRRCLSPQGEFRRDPPDAGGARAPARAGAAAGGASLSIFLVATRNMVARRGETRPITANRRQPENRTARIKGPGPRPAPGRRIVSGGRAQKRRHDNPPAMAKRAVQRPSFALRQLRMIGRGESRPITADRKLTTKDRKRSQT